MLTFLASILVLAYCAIAGHRCAAIDDQDYENGIMRSIPGVMLRGMLWPVTVVGWLVERPAQLLLPPPGEDVP